MAGDDELRGGGAVDQTRKPVQHGLQISDDGKRLSRKEILVVMRRVRGKDEPARAGFDPHRLQAARMAADGDHLNAGCDGGIAVMESDAARVDVPDHLTDMLCRERHLQGRMAHARAGSKRHFGGLQVELRLGKRLQPAGVIVMQMGDDHRGHIRCINPEIGEHPGRVREDRTVAALTFARIIAGIDHNRTVFIADDPDEIVHRVRAGVVVVKNKRLRACSGVALGVFQGEYFVNFVHCVLLMSSAQDCPARGGFARHWQERETLMREQVRALFDAAIAAADPAAAVARFGDAFPAPRSGGRLAVIAIGKAAAPMMRQAVEMIPEGTDWQGLLVTNAGNEVQVPNCRTIVGGHPLPDTGSAQAGQAMLDLIGGLGAQDAVLALISGGGSALAVAPRLGISLADKIALNAALLAGGFDINEMNEVRQQLSALKGGGLVRAAHPAPVHALILSDVIGDDLRAIASGPTVAPIGNKRSAKALLEGRGVFDALPDAIRSVLDGPDESDSTPAAQNTLIGSNTQSVDAVMAAAGDRLARLDAPVIGDVHDAANMLAGHTERSFAGGGETTVTLTGSGRGGRNQELALRFAQAVQHLEVPWVFLSGGTDGRDGPTDAAGAIVDHGTLERIAAAGLDIDAILADNDAYRALEAAGDLVKMPATGTNVADIQIFMRTV